MKKYYIALLLLMLLNLIPQKTTLTQIAKEQGVGEYSFVVSGEYEGSEFDRIQKNGNITILTCPAYQAAQKKEDVKGEILGESFCFLGVESDADALIQKLQAKVVRKSTVDDITIYYLWSGSLNSESIELFSQKVNMQIAVTKGRIEVGVPVLLGSY